MAKRKTQRRVVGDIVKISLPDGYNTYARALEEGLFAFYDSRTQKALYLDEIIARPILFQVPVMRHAVTRGRWIKVGNVPLDKALLRPPPRFMQDALDKNIYHLYERGTMR